MQSLRAVDTEQIYNHLVSSVAANAALRERWRPVDINHIINVQRDQEVRRARQRRTIRCAVAGPAQSLHSLRRRPLQFHETNPEHIKLAAVPATRLDDPELMAATVEARRHQVGAHRHYTRMDALWIVHGLPVTLLERLDEFYLNLATPWTSPSPPVSPEPAVGAVAGGDVGDGKRRGGDGETRD
ncbi:MAG: hypothetical protein R2854_30940 [Caldilineaceae bacterium]